MNNKDYEKVYEPFIRNKHKPHKGCSRYHRHFPRYTHFREECCVKPPVNNTLFENLNKDYIIDMAFKYKHQFVREVYETITKNIYENAEKGITQFITEEFSVAPTHEEPNVLSKLSDDDIRRIEKDFRDKGIDIKSRMDPARKSVRFVIKVF